MTPNYRLYAFSSALLLLSCNQPEQKPNSFQKIDESEQNTDPQKTNINCLALFEKGETTCTDSNGDIITNQHCDENWDESCSGMTANYCNEDGYISSRDCTTQPGTVCKKIDANFVDCVMPCTPDEFVEYTGCQGDYTALHTCELTTDNDYYEFIFTDKHCSFGCKNGVCNTQITGQEGDSCKADTFIGFCKGNDSYICKDGKITRDPCPTGTTCAMQYGGRDAQCTKDCKVYDQNDKYACNGNALDNWVCRVGTDDRFHYFHETDNCKNSCNKGVCDITIPQIGTICDPATTNDICAQNTLYFCSTINNTIDVMECGLGDYQGLPLCRQLNEGYSDCVSPGCNPDDPDSNSLECATEKNDDGTKFKYVYGWECVKATDGTYYMFNIEERCEGECKNGKCL